MRCFKVMPVQKLHRDEGVPILIADFVDGANVRMIESGSRTSFPAKALQGMRITCEFIG